MKINVYVINIYISVDALASIPPNSIPLNAQERQTLIISIYFVVLDFDKQHL